MSLTSLGRCVSFTMPLFLMQDFESLAFKMHAFKSKTFIERVSSYFFLYCKATGQLFCVLGQALMKNNKGF